MIGRSILKTGLFHPDSENKPKLLNGFILENSIFLSLAIGVYANYTYQLNINVFFIFLCAAVFSSLIMLYDLNKKNILCYLVFIGTIVSFVILGKVLKWNYIKAVKHIYDWCMTYDRQEDTYNNRYALVVMILLLLIISIIAYILHHIKQMKYIIAVTLILVMIVATINKVFIPKLTVGISLLYALLVLAELCGRMFHKGNSSVDNTIATVYLVPVCFLIIILTMFLPSNSEPMKWKGIKTFIYEVQEQSSIWVSDIRYYLNKKDNEFSVNLADYTEEDNGELGGNVSVSKKNSLIVSAPNRSTSRGYLIGSISDTYTGRRWEKSIRNKEYESEEYYLDFYQLLFTFAKEYQQGTDLSNLVMKRNYQIEYRNIRTNTLFYPLKTYKITLSKYMNYDDTVQGAILFQKAKGKGTKYKVDYYELNLNNDILKNILRKEDKENYTLSPESLKKVGDTIFGYDLAAVQMDYPKINQVLEERTTEIKEDYTALPENLPDRVKDLAHEITKGCDNNYDKMKALEAYLNTMPYSLSMDKTPKGEDFVDYFLFHQKKGYCTYYASALAVMARSMGIPTRYVEGFVVDYKDAVSADRYRVFSKSAHAWVDAYIDGIGWIPFEPTPTFQAGRYVKWREVSTVIEAGYHDPGVKLQEDLQARYQKEYYEKMEKERQNKKEINEKFKLIFCLTSISIFLLSIIIIYVYYNILERKYYNKYKHSSNNLKVFLLLTEVLRYLEIEGFKLLPEETISVFSKRVGDRFEFDHYTFGNLADLFMKARYGEKEVNGNELRAAYKFNKDFQKDVYSKMSSRKMFFDRFVFLHFNQ